MPSSLTEEPAPSTTPHAPNADSPCPSFPLAASENTGCSGPQRVCRYLLLFSLRLCSHVSGLPLFCTFWACLWLLCFVFLSRRSVFLFLACCFGLSALSVFLSRRFLIIHSLPAFLSFPSFQPAFPQLLPFLPFLFLSFPFPSALFTFLPPSAVRAPLADALADASTMPLHDSLAQIPGF